MELTVSGHKAYAYTGGKPFGGDQSLAVFGKPGDSKFEFVMTGRHMTLRCDGNSTEHLAFGGPIFYGHAASGFNETPGHPGNVYWEQALAANKVYEMLDGKQRARAEVAKSLEQFGVHLPRPSLDVFTGLGNVAPLLATAIPLGIYNFTEAMNNVESASAAGEDRKSTRLNSSHRT